MVFSNNYIVTNDFVCQNTIEPDSDKFNPISGIEGAPVADAQGRLEGAAASGYLQSAAKSDLENELSILRQSVIPEKWASYFALIELNNPV